MLVRGACPHDCPDTCAMHVTVEDGRAVKVAGDPDHPITVGFLCGKVSNYLDRVYSDERVLHPLVGGKRASWDAALDVVAEGLLRARDEFGGESILPYSYMGTQGLIQADLMSARVMNALGASNLERTICATAGYTGTLMTHGFSPEVDPEEWPHARYVIVWGWNPLSTAPHLWRKLLDARANGARLIVVDPFRSRTARVADEHLSPLPGTDAALAIGMMRAIVDAGLQDEDWCREHADGYDELLAALGERSVEDCAAICGVPAEDIARVGREFASTRPALLRLGVGAQRHMGAPTAYSTIASLPALVGAWRERGGGCSYIPLATAAAVSDAPLKREDLRPGPVRTINMSRLGEALTDPSLDPPIKAFVCWSSNPAAIAPDQSRVLEGLRRDDLLVVVLEQFMTDTAQLADVVLPATTQLEHRDVVFSWGHHYLTWNEPAIEPLGEAKPNTEAFRLIAQRLGLDDPCFRDSDEQLVDELLAGFDEGELRTRGWRKIDLGQGPVPHAEGGFGTETGRVALHADYLPPVEVADAALAERFPLALITPKTHLFLNSTFANQARQHAAQPSPSVVLHPADAADRGVDDGDQVRVFNERGSFACAARVSDDARAGVVVAPMGWWNSDYAEGRSAQATTSQALTELGHAPTFNDNRVEVQRLPVTLLALLLAFAAPAPAVPPPNAKFDYQIGGDYPLPRGVEVVSRDWFIGSPAPGAYSICYVNAFQTQDDERGVDRPDERSNWPAKLVLSRLGDDPNWGGEYLVDISSPRKRARAADWIQQMIQGCADKGFDAVEYDNLDSWTRFDGTPVEGRVPFGKEQAIRYARVLTRRAHALGLAVAQKNTLQLTRHQSRERIGFDFAIAEECGRYRECEGFRERFGNHVIDIEYRRRDFRWSCAAVGKQLSVVLRDVNVTRPGSRTYRYAAC